ncbi:Bcr/CflA family efflux MFS transporter [Marinomonas agarivorans]|nr:Bcr/CflA family efflux MFS transporter [Marinomonas agarivorans]
MKSHYSTAFIVFLLALTVSGPISINFYLALLPDIGDSLSASVSKMQQTVSIYLIGFAGAQLFIGPLSDKFGRRPVLIFCYLLFSLASLLCAFANESSFLSIGRLIQSLGGCAGVLISRAIVRDVYPPEDMGRIMSYMIMGFSIAPLIAPALGGFVGVYFGWRSLFFVLAGFGLFLAAWAYLGFKETNKSLNIHAMKPSQLIQNYMSLLSNKSFLCYLIVISFSVAGILTYTTASSFVLIKVLHVSTEHYGLLFGVSALGMLLGSLCSTKISKQFNSEFTVLSGAVCLVIGGTLLMVFPWLNIVSVFTLVGPMFIYALGNGAIMPSAMALAIAPFSRKAGAAAALIGCTQAALGALCGYIAGALYNNTATPMTSIIGLLSIAVFGIVLYMKLSNRRNVVE